MSQRDRIRAHLLTHGSITPLEALREYGCFRLGARIWELRRDGFPVEPTTEEQGGKRYAKYVYAGDGQQRLAL